LAEAAILLLESFELLEEPKLTPPDALTPTSPMNTTMDSALTPLSRGMACSKSERRRAGALSICA
jgi:hypothetical protein